MKKKSIFFVLLSLFALILAGCQDIFKGLSESDCRGDKIGGPDRQLSFIVRNYIYVGGTGTVWDENAYTIGFGQGRWQNGALVKNRLKAIEVNIAAANEIFEQNGLNVSFTNYATNVYVDQNMIPCDCPAQMAACDGHTADVIAQTYQNDTGALHIHWSWRNQTSMVDAVGYSSSVVVCDDPWWVYSEPITELVFAHELVHALGYGKHSDEPGNLMHDPTSGMELTQEQLKEIWSTIADSSLAVLNCKK